MNSKEIRILMFILILIVDIENICSKLIDVHFQIR